MTLAKHGEQWQGPRRTSSAQSPRTRCAVRCKDSAWLLPRQEGTPMGRLWMGTQKARCPWRGPSAPVSILLGQDRGHRP